MSLLIKNGRVITATDDYVADIYCDAESITRIERYCDGPYLELFARQERVGWTAWGNQTDRFEAAA